MKNTIPPPPPLCPWRKRRNPPPMPFSPTSREFAEVVAQLRKEDRAETMAQLRAFAGGLLITRNLIVLIAVVALCVTFF